MLEHGTPNSLADPATSYEQKKARGVVPHWPVNHGISTSMYYTDPDGNEFEMQVNNFDTSEEALAFMATDWMNTGRIQSVWISTWRS